MLAKDFTKPQRVIKDGLENFYNFVSKIHSVVPVFGEMEKGEGGRGREEGGERKKEGGK